MSVRYESYNGINVRLRYFLRFSIIVKKSLMNIVKELDFWVNNYQVEPDINNSIKMEVGIEDCLHIEFEYNRSKYVQPSAGSCLPSNQSVVWCASLTARQVSPKGRCDR